MAHHDHGHGEAHGQGHGHGEAHGHDAHYRYGAYRPNLGLGARGSLPPHYYVGNEEFEQITPKYKQVINRAFRIGESWAKSPEVASRMIFEKMGARDVLVNRITWTFVGVGAIAATFKLLGDMGRNPAEKNL